MTSPANRDFRRITAFLGSKRFFGAIVALLIVQAAWLALSGRYPMAFDEDFHLGIIRLYAHHISPFWSGQPAGANAFGAVARDPSYLYQYLMSFPYRLVSVFTSSQTAQVLVLRFINIGLFAAALPLYRRLLLKTGASRAIVHLCLAIFVLIPVVPLLAAQINYDNLLLPMTALSLLLTVNFTQGLRRTRRLNLKNLLWLAIVVTLTCLVKYAFLAILLVIGAYLVIQLWRAYPDIKVLRPGPAASWLLIILLVLSLGLFTQRYAVNIARYHKPVPECDKVLSVKQCRAYPPWNRDYVLTQTKGDARGTDSPLTFTADWFYGMWLRTFFAVDGPASNFATRGPLILPGIGAIVFASAALLATVVTMKRLLRRYDASVIWLFISVTAVYVGALWLNGYQSFLQTGQAEAINGRYLLPVLPLLLVILALGVNTLLGHRQALKIAFASASLLCLLWGGGALTYILRSDNSWYWHNQTVYDANHAVRNTLGPITPGYYSPTEFMSRN
jgi:hypothetical protein